MRLQDPQVGQQRGHRLRRHRGTPVGADRVRDDAAVDADRLLDEMLRQITQLRRVHLPVYDPPGEYVDHDVQVVAHPRIRPLQFRYVPRPYFVRAAGYQLRFLRRRVTGLRSPLVHLPGLPQDAVHRRHRRQVDAFVDQHRPHLPRRLVPKPRAVQHVQQMRTLRRGQRVRRRQPRQPRLVSGRSRRSRAATTASAPHAVGR